MSFRVGLIHRANNSRMSYLVFILLLLANSAKCDWDLAILTSSSIELLQNEHVTSAHVGVKELTAFTYDPLLLHHYFAASGHPNASIFRVQMARDGRMGPVEPLVKKQPGEIFGLAYDAESTSVFFTFNNTIMWSQLDVGLTEAEVLHSFENEHPLAIAAEPCSRYIYWSYRHSNIDRSLMDGTKKERVVENLFMPVAISISQAERMIYWVDEGPGYGFSIGRALLDGSKKEIVHHGSYQQPTSLAISSQPTQEPIIYWTDIMNSHLYSFMKNATTPAIAYTFTEPIYAVSVANSFDQLDKHVCSKLIAMRDQVPYMSVSPTAAPCVHGSFSSHSASCICNPGYIGALCETSICYNYCLSGSCSMTGGKPYCRCPAGKTGLRCEVDRCRGHCFHGGCATDESDALSCDCHPGWYGPRCNYSQSYCDYLCSQGLYEQENCRCNASYASAIIAPSSYFFNFKLGFMVTAGTCGLMALCLIILAVRNWRLGKRPRIKRFYRVTPNKGSAPQPVRTSPDCQIAIENCCNMNFCDTPCYEPELRPSDGKIKKEEKRGLLKEMVVQPDTGNTF